jgi:cardiolipin-specific phospholipase
LAQAEANLLSLRPLHRERPISSTLVPIDASNHMNVLHSGSLATLSKSKAPPVVLLHGFGAGAAMWFLNIDDIARRTGRDVLAVDLLGFGRSSRTKMAATSPAEAEAFFVDSLRQLFDKLELERVALVGHSLGGFISAVFAMQNRARVEKLVLASPVGVPMRPADFDFKAQSRPFRVLLNLWERGVTPQALVRFAGPRGEKLVDSVVRRRFWTLSSEQHDHLAAYVYQISVAAASGEHSMNNLLMPGAFARLPLENRIEQLDPTLETLWLYGASDWMDPRKPIEWMGADNRTRRAWQLRFVEDAGHQLFMERPARFNELCSDFLRQV